MNPDFRLPEHWTPEQANAFLDIVEQLHDAVWQQYGETLTKLLMRRPPGESFWNDVDEKDKDWIEDDSVHDLYEPLP